MRLTNERGVERALEKTDDEAQRAQRAIRHPMQRLHGSNPVFGWLIPRGRDSETSSAL
jgi:hypothetical protein